MPTVQANGIELCYERRGDPGDPSILLVAGHGVQLIWWPDELIDELVGIGLSAVVFDNRDSGLSTHLHGAPVPDLLAIASGDHSTMAYSIEEMADDAAALCDALGVEDAHVLGVSMGGMVAQSLAIRHPRLVRTLTSVMSSPDPLHVGTPANDVVEGWLHPAPTSREEVIDQTVASWRVSGSPELGFDEPALRDLAGRLYDRSYDPAGVGRQLGAIVGSPDRRPGLANVAVPTLVVHGADDKNLTVEGGVATAEAVPGAELVVIDKMGHDLARAAWPTLLQWYGSLVGV